MAEPKLDPLKFCCDCGWYRSGFIGEWMLCIHPNNTVEPDQDDIDLVTGKGREVSYAAPPRMLRRDPERCGPRAKWFSVGPRKEA